MCVSLRNVRLLLIKLLVLYVIDGYHWSVFSLSLSANNKSGIVAHCHWSLGLWTTVPIAGKSSLNRKNDKFNRSFHKSDELSTPGSELRYSIDRNDQKLNTSLIVSLSELNQSNEFTEMLSQNPVLYRPVGRPESRPETSSIRETVKDSNKECQCTCDNAYVKANQLINEFVLNDNEDPDMDIDDNEELEKLQKPYKCESHIGDIRPLFTSFELNFISLDVIMSKVFD